MKLLVDAGNTRIKWAIIDPGNGAGLGGWLQTGSMNYAEFAAMDTPWGDIEVQDVLISNVAGAAVAAQLEASFVAKKCPVSWFTSQAQLAGVHNNYRNPVQLGCDRFATVIAVHALFPDQNVVVATCGTATTIDAVSLQGDFVGGMIVPGLKLMAESLQKNTAQLPAVAGKITSDLLFADYTEAAIVSGCLSAQAGAIEHALAAYTETCRAVGITDGLVPLKQTSHLPICILSGGAAPYIAPELRIAHQCIANLVLIGLQVVSQ